VTLEDLRVFNAVCESHSLSAVARTLDCTQPAVAQHVARLERELGARLLERTPKGIAVTPAGRLLYEATSASLGALAMARREIQQLQDGTGGRLSVATGGTTVRHFMRDAVMQFRKRHPDAAIHFEPGDSSRHCLDAVARRVADMAFVTMSHVQRGFEQRPLLRMPLVLLVRRDDRLAQRRGIRTRDLRAIRYIGLPDSTSSHGFIREQLAQESVTLIPVMHVDDWDTANVFVELGLGHAIVPAVHGRSFSRGGRVAAVPIRGLAPISVGWAARSFALLPTLAIEFMDLLRKTVTQWADIPGLEVIADN
jgi:DNA-binding transcriptional LysR family regulator